MTTEENVWKIISAVRQMREIYLEDSSIENLDRYLNLIDVLISEVSSIYDRRVRYLYTYEKGLEQGGALP